MNVNAMSRKFVAVLVAVSGLGAVVATSAVPVGAATSSADPLFNQ